MYKQGGVKRYLSLIVLTLMVGNIKAQEFPICIAVEDQLYPDVAFDGTNFWAVWADKRSGTFEIYGARITPQGVVLDDSGILLASLPDTDYTMPSVAFGDSIGCIAFHIDVPYDTTWHQFKNVGVFRFNKDGSLLDSIPKFMMGNFGPPYEWGYENIPSVVSGKESFFLFLEYWIVYQIEVFSGIEIWGLRNDSLARITEIGCEQIMPYEMGAAGAWNGKNFLTVWSAVPGMSFAIKGAFLEDSLYEHSEIDSFIIRRLDRDSVQWEWGYSPKDREVCYGSNRYLLISEIQMTSIQHSKIWYDVLSDSGKPIDSLPHIIDNGDSVDQWMPTCTYLDNRFIAIWQDAISNSSNLYGVIIDTLGEILDSGYINWASFKKVQPSIATDGNKTLLVWADNRNGNFDIYGRIMDSLGVGEDARSKGQEARIEVEPNPFVRSTIIKYELPLESKVSLKLYDISGRCIRTLVDKEEKSGCYEVKLETGDLSSGIYFVNLECGGYKEVKKLTVLR